MSNSYRTSLGTSTKDSIRLLGEDLPNDLMGEISFGDLAFWLVALRKPSAGESKLFNAILVALADHGFTPTVLAARLTLTGAPESIQGAMASGLLGGGSRFLGVTEDAAQFLADGLAAENLGSSTVPTGGYDALAKRMLLERKENGGPVPGLAVPGLGHPVHKDGDPRTPVVYRIAAEAGIPTPHLSLLAAIGRVHPEILGRRLPVNGAGVCGAALADLGFPPGIIRGFALLARSAGLLGHLAEELRDPIGMRVYAAVDRHAEYVPVGDMSAIVKDA